MTDRHADKRATMIANLPHKTGRTLEEWVTIVANEAPDDGHKARVDWLKATYDLGHFQARLIVTAAKG